MIPVNQFVAVSRLNADLYEIVEQREHELKDVQATLNEYARIVAEADKLSPSLIRKARERATKDKES